MTLLSQSRGVPPLRQAGSTGTAWHNMLAAISEPNFVTVFAFCTIGLLVTLNVMLRFPNLGSLIEQYNQF